MGRAGGDQGVATGQRPGLAKGRFNGLDDPRHLGQAPIAFLAAGEIAGPRPDLLDGTRRQDGQIGLGGRVGPHHHIHRGRHQDRLVGRQKQGRGQIVGQAMGHLGDQIGRRRRHHQEIGLAAGLDVTHPEIVGQREQILEHRLFGQRRQSQGRHELGAAFGQHAPHQNAPLPQTTDQIEAFIGRDTPGDDQ